jgi:hypothetical protein
MKFTTKEKHYIKDQILKDIFDLNVKVYGLDIATTVHKVGIDIRVDWFKGYKKTNDDVTKLHLNYVIPYNWRRKEAPNPYVRGSYNEWGYYYMSTIDYERNNKLEELLNYK